MCGIFGIVTDKEQALGPILIEAARRLTYRGYDSVGAATISGATIGKVPLSSYSPGIAPGRRPWTLIAAAEK